MTDALSAGVMQVCWAAVFHYMVSLVIRCRSPVMYINGGMMCAAQCDFNYAESGCCT